MLLDSAELELINQSINNREKRVLGK